MTVTETCMVEELAQVVLRKDCCWISDVQVVDQPMRLAWKTQM